MPNRILIAALIGLVAAALAVATGTGEQAATEASSTEMAQMGMEAPALAEQVAAGTLPPLAERLPDEPYVVQPFGEIGRYGGDLRRVYRTASDGLAYGRLVMETLLRFSPGKGTDVEPNIARDFSVSDDATSITLYLREGMRWSDGEPFTADDIMFWYEDWAMNTDLNPSPPTWMTVGGEPGVWEKIDDYTVRLTFPGVNGLAARQLADPSGASRGMGRMIPKHYLSQFHPTYQTKEKLDEMVAAAELDSWVDLFSDRNNYFLNADLPVLDAWDITVAAPAQRVVAERNPYYWKVDTEGHQLPYMDRVVHDQVENAELILLKATNGELDVQWRHMSFSDFTLLKENEEAGDYKVFSWSGDRASRVALWPNMSAQDPQLREFFNKFEVRKALSLAVDRDEINKLFYFGLGVPRQLTAISGEPTYEADVASLYIEYDADESNRLLDAAGYASRNASGVRTFPDGKAISLLMEYATSWPFMGDEGEVVCSQFQQIGIDCQVKPLERAVWYQKSAANEFGLVLFTSPGTSFSNNWWVVPAGAHNHRGYGDWYRSNGAEGEEPPEDMQRIMALFRSLGQATDSDEQVGILREVLRYKVENLWGIGLVGENPTIGIVRNAVGNVPERLPYTTGLMSPYNGMPEQWYFRN